MALRPRPLYLHLEHDTLVILLCAPLYFLEDLKLHLKRPTPALNKLVWVEISTLSLYSAQRCAASDVVALDGNIVCRRNVGTSTNDTIFAMSATCR